MKPQIFRRILIAGTQENKLKIKALVKALKQVTGLISIAEEFSSELKSDLVMVYERDLNSLDLHAYQKFVVFSDQPVLNPHHIHLSSDSNSLRVAGDLPKLIYDSLSYSLDPVEGNFSTIDLAKYPSHEYSTPAINAVAKSLLTSIQDLLNESTFYMRNTHPKNATFSIALTHDIDYWSLGFLEKLKLGRNLVRSLVNGPLALNKFYATSKYCLNHNPIDLRRLELIEKKFGVRSSLFFSGFAPKPSDRRMLSMINPGYAFQNIHLEPLDFDHFELGIHGSTASYNNAGRFKEELQVVGSQSKVLGGRQHMLSYEPTKTFEIFDSSGLVYDSTMGFNNFNGFRNLCGFTHNPIRPTDSSEYNFVEVPLVFMDSVITKSGVPNEVVFDREIKQFTQTAKEHSISGAICWHDVSFRVGSIMETFYSNCLELWLQEGAFVGRAIDLALFHNSCRKLSSKVEGDDLWISHPESTPFKVYLKKTSGKNLVSSMEVDLSNDRWHLLT